MVDGPVGRIIRHFDALEDPRIDRRKLHDLTEMIIIALCATICGADSLVAIERFGNAKLSWFQTFLDLGNGIPSHDTFGRVFAALDPEQFASCFMGWTQSLGELMEGQVVALDGKMLRRSMDTAAAKSPMYMVSAWAGANRLVLGQLKVDEKSNEITAVPKLLDMLMLEGSVVTTDALGCQKEIAQKVLDKGADYLLAVKDNQKTLVRDLQSLFDEAELTSYRHVESDHAQTGEKGHGRIENRRCLVISDPRYLFYLEGLKWPGLRSIVKLEAERKVGEKSETHTRYYISSLPGDAAKTLAAARGHWGIENSLHWVLDIGFREDESRIRQGNATENMARLRQIALNLLSREKTAKCGIATKRLMAGWDESYLAKVLSA
jgi:predicted transposase YbfD/YdcC